MMFLLPLLLAALTPEPIAIPQVARVKVGINSTTTTLGIDWSGKSADGSDHPFEILKVHLEFTNPALPSAKQTITVALANVQPGTVKIPWADALKGLPSGDWDCTARFEDEVGQLSGASPVTPRSQFEVHVSNPSAPANVGAVAN